jgi:hypothetical protein
MQQDTIDFIHEAVGAEFANRHTRCQNFEVNHVEVYFPRYTFFQEKCRMSKAPLTPITKKLLPMSWTFFLS